jgi:hypothetical protein
VLSDDGEDLTFCVEAPPGSATERNVTLGSPIAVTLSRPTTYSSVQLKGAVTHLRAPGAAELERVAAHVDRFVGETAALGLDPSVVRRLPGDELVTIVVAIVDRYDQTPGMGAGAQL